MDLARLDCLPLHEPLVAVHVCWLDVRLLVDLELVLTACVLLLLVLVVLLGGDFDFHLLVVGALEVVFVCCLLLFGLS